MIIVHNPDDWEAKFEHRPCPFHEKHPGKSYAGCTCSASHSYVRRKTRPKLVIEGWAIKPIYKFVAAE